VFEIVGGFSFPGALICQSVIWIKFETHSNRNKCLLWMSIASIHCYSWMSH
jgi:hypothetical protein